jgi:predicted enzyme related to lactoylglutathione lyase
MSAVLADVVFDCADPERLAAFWAEVLGRPIAGRRGPYVWLAEGSVGVAFQRSDAAKVGKNRVHVDLRVPDVAAAQSLVESLGGSRAPGYEDGGFLVMADPEGNEFCVLPEGPLGMDEEGNAHYL